ncbi:glycoside hydrolase [Aspergillus californicus]
MMSSISTRICPRILPILATLFIFPSCIQTKAVFAHFMLANTANYTLQTWQADMHAAKESHIDAFALNSGHGARHTAESLDNAFTAATELDFKLFFSFDYSGGHWPKDEVIDLLQEYIPSPAYFKYNGKPLITTFEGFEAAKDWANIKRAVGDSFFIPDWTSVGPQRASAVSAIDGLMCWDAWPDGANAMNTTEDEEYMRVLGAKPYIMPVSPWFYTNMEQFDKNWVWRGDDLWYTRWEQVLELGPEMVEIISWNDYGESHYIGPVHPEGTGILAEADAPFDYVDGMPHDGWRVLLPFLIQQYKADGAEERGKVPIAEEVLNVWYRLSPAAACGDGGTTGNTETQHQRLLDPADVSEDKVFYSALLEEAADVSVSIGGDNRTAEWMGVPEGGRGVYHGSVAMEDGEGEVVVTLTRDGDFLAEMKGKNIETQGQECPHNQTNWNAWVGNAWVANATAESGLKGGRGAKVSPSAIQGVVVVVMALTTLCLL